MSITARQIMRTARDIITDTEEGFYRQSDDELLRYVNDGLRECALLVPQLFYVTGDMECMPNATEQGLAFDDALTLAEVIRVRDGRMILPCDMLSFSAFNPGWGNDPQGEALHWMRHPSDLLRFYLYPKAPYGQVIEVKYVRNPAPVLIDELIEEVSPSLHPALVNYVVAKAEMKDDEHVNSGRSVAAYQQFVGLLKPGA